LITVDAYDPSPWMLFTAIPMNAPGVPPKSREGSENACPLMPPLASGWFWPLTPLVSGGLCSCAAARVAISNVTARMLQRISAPFGRGTGNATEPFFVERQNRCPGHAGIPPKCVC
jgi:hypothetical protein